MIHLHNWDHYCLESELPAFLKTWISTLLGSLCSVNSSTKKEPMQQQTTDKY